MQILETLVFQLLSEQLELDRFFDSLDQIEQDLARTQLQMECLELPPGYEQGALLVGASLDGLQTLAVALEELRICAQNPDVEEMESLLAEAGEAHQLLCEVFEQTRLNLECLEP